MALCTLWIYWTRQDSHHIRDYSYPLFPIDNTLLNIIVVVTVEESSKTKQSLWSATWSGGMPFFTYKLYLSSDSPVSNEVPSLFCEDSVSSITLITKFIQSFHDVLQWQKSCILTQHNVKRVF